jgi:hypothetical protein
MTLTITIIAVALFVVFIVYRQSLEKKNIKTLLIYRTYNKFLRFLTLFKR